MPARSSTTGEAPEYLARRKVSAMRWTTMPRTKLDPFGSGRDRPYLYHQRAEQSRKLRTWEGDSTSATCDCGKAGGPWLGAGGISTSSGVSSNSENRSEGRRVGRVGRARRS